MAFPVQNSAVAAKQIAKFTSRYSPDAAPNLRKLAAVYLAGVQEWQNAIWAVLYGRFLSNATGADLDVLGDLVGQPRTGLDDNTYRAAIRLRIKANRSQGRSEDVCRIAVIAAQKLTTDANGVVRYYERGTMAFDVTIDNLAYTSIVWSLLSEARAASSRGRLVYSLHSAPTMNRYGSVYSGSAGSGGFASTYGTAGGLMYGALAL